MNMILILKEKAEEGTSLRKIFNGFLILRGSSTKPKTAV